MCWTVWPGRKNYIAYVYAFTVHVRYTRVFFTRVHKWYFTRQYYLSDRVEPVALSMYSSLSVFLSLCFSLSLSIHRPLWLGKCAFHLATFDPQQVALIWYPTKCSITVVQRIEHHFAMCWPLVWSASTSRCTSRMYQTPKRNVPVMVEALCANTHAQNCAHRSCKAWGIGSRNATSSAHHSNRTKRSAILQSHYNDLRFIVVDIGAMENAYCVNGDRETVI